MTAHEVVILPFALGAADGTASLALDAQASSLRKEPGQFGTTEVIVRDVARMFDELALERIDLLKLNIEGGEFDVLDRLFETGWLDRIAQVSVQFHEWHPDAYRRRRRSRAQLRGTHEELWCYPWVWEFWTRRAQSPRAKR